MSELWGFTSGVEQGAEFNSKQQLAQLAIQEGGIDVQQKNINLKASELSLQQQQNTMRAMAVAASGGKAGSNPQTNMSDFMANQLYASVPVLLAGGRIEEAATVAAKAGELQVHAHEIDKANAEKDHKLWGDVADTMANVKDDASWKSAQMAFAMEHPDEVQLPTVQQLFQKKFGELNIQSITDAALSQKEQAATKASTSRANADDARAQVAKSEVPLNKQREREAKARADALAKAGSKPDELPKSADVNYVMDLVKQNYDLDTPDGNSYEAGKARAESTEVAASAKGVMAKNTGMSKKEALDIAFQAHQQSKGFAGLKPIDRSIGASSGKPLSLPKDLNSLEDNKWYMAPGKDKKPVSQYYSNGKFWTAGAIVDAADDSDSNPDDDIPAR